MKKKKRNRMRGTNLGWLEELNLAQMELAGSGCSFSPKKEVTTDGRCDGGSKRRSNTYHGGTR